MTPQTLEYPAAKGALSLPLDLWLPDTAPRDWCGLVVYAHGGGFAHGTRRDRFARILAGKVVTEGFALASIDYRLRGTPPSPWTERQHALIAAEQARCARVVLRC